MLRKLLLLLAMGLGFLIVKAPASLVDGLLAHFTAEGLRLQRAEGTLWEGRGILASRDASGRSLSPWLPVAWDFDIGALARVAAAWTFSSSGTPIGRIEAGISGLDVTELTLHAPADAALMPIPNPVARAGWQGDLSITAPVWHCTPTGTCSGEARLLWRGARAALFPGRRFGDYEIQLTARDGRFRYTLRTLAGDVIANGSGEAAPGRTPSFKGSIKGEPEFLNRLPSIAAGAARPTGQPGQFEIQWPPP
ncbi:type II secretion system protein N [Zoogloea sp.]|uniref:type II secretion system protein N n=1 Tax=Zoogloea sp. TaxID=49181 RepID=UPI0035B3284F